MLRVEFEGAEPLTTFASSSGLFSQRALVFETERVRITADPSAVVAASSSVAADRGGAVAAASSGFTPAVNGVTSGLSARRSRWRLWRVFSAQEDAMVRVEFEATEPLVIFASSSVRFSQPALVFENENMRMSECVRIAAAPSAGVATGAPVAASNGVSSSAAANREGAVATASPGCTPAVNGVTSVFSARRSRWRLWWVFLQTPADDATRRLRHMLPPRWSPTTFGATANNNGASSSAAADRGGAVAAASLGFIGTASGARVGACGGCFCTHPPTTQPEGRATWRNICA